MASRFSERLQTSEDLRDRLHTPQSVAVESPIHFVADPPEAGNGRLAIAHGTDDKTGNAQADTVSGRRDPH